MTKHILFNRIHSSIATELIPVLHIRYVLPLNDPHDHLYIMSQCIMGALYTESSPMHDYVNFNIKVLIFNSVYILFQIPNGISLIFQIKSCSKTSHY